MASTPERQANGALQPSTNPDQGEADEAPAAIRALRSGDVVVVNRPWVNGRAWMSTRAPAQVALKKGKRAELLGDPSHSSGLEWVKARPSGSDEACYLPVKYLDLSEASPDGTEDPPAAPRAADLPTALQEGDLFRTTARVNLRSGPGPDHPVIALMTPNALGIVAGTTLESSTGAWIEVQFPGIAGWIAARYISRLDDHEKWIEIDLSLQTLTAWSDASMAATFPVSSGKPGFETPAGAFSITSKRPTRHVRATVKGETWDIPGVPWVMTFRRGGFYIHGVYWHDDFGTPVSHGCVTLAVPDADWLYEWTPTGTRVWIHRGNVDAVSQT